MYKKLFLTAPLWIALAACSTTTKKQPEVQQADSIPIIEGALSYTLDYSRCTDVPCLKISIEFQGNKEGKTTFHLPNQNSGQKELFRAIHQLKPTSSDVLISATADPSVMDLKFPPDSKIKLQYEVTQDFKGKINGQEQYYRAMISDDHFFVFGEQVFARPRIENELPREITLTLKNSRLPYADSFAVGTKPRHLHISLDEFRHGTFLGGNFHFSHFTVHGKPINTAILGKFGFTQAEFNRLLGRIFKAEREFWNDHDFPYFLVTAIPAMENGRGGTGRTNSFSLFFNAKTKIDHEMIYLLAHELFHTWNGRRIERVDPEELQYWFSEGFTDYYMSVLAFRAGLIDFKEYIRAFNEVIKRYTLSKARNEKAERVLKDFWNDGAVEKLPYQQGDLLAHRWNRMIIDQTHGLHTIDDFMKDLLSEARKLGTKVSAENIDRLIRKYLPNGIHDDHERFIVNGETIPLDAAELGPCVRIENHPSFIFSLWLNEVLTKKDHVIHGVDPHGPAFAAGLRDGMVVKGWDHSRDQFKAHFTVLVDSIEKEIYYEAKGPTISVPSFIIDENEYKKDKQRCEAIVRGEIQ